MLDCSGCWSVFVDESGAGGGALDRHAEFDHGRLSVVAGCSLVEALVWAVVVVVLDEVVEESVELLLVPDEGAVEEFVADGSDPSFGERVGLWRTWWRLDRLGADGGEDVVEGAGVLAGAIVDHEPDRLLVDRGQVAGCLGGPGSGGVGGDPGDVDASGVEFDEEQDVNPAEGDGVDTEEVGGDHGVGLAVNELAPGRSGPIRYRLAAVVAEGFPYGGGGDVVSEAAEFAVDASVAPGRVFGVQAEHEAAEFGRCWWPPGSSLWWLGPVAGYETAVPVDHGCGLDDQHHVSQSLSVEGTR